jgi:VWFA-related protein
MIDMRTRKRSYWYAVLASVSLALLLTLLPLAVVQAQNQQPIPDAPSATRPFPKPQISPTSPPAAPEPSGQENQQPATTDDQGNQQPPAPPLNIRTVPEGGATKEANTNSRDELFTVIKNVNFVQVPVSVKDDQGHLIAGLLPKDFTIIEDNQPQKITFFTSDPFPLSAAVVLDLAMSDVAVSRVRETLPALVGAFGQFDEVSLYTYDNTVARVQGFTPAQNDVFIQTVRKLQRNATGRSGGVPVTSGPMASGPSVNGHPVDPGATATVNAPQNASIYRPESHVLNDAILQAALELAKRDRTRRKVLFVVSNGRELGSDASYREVLRVLQTQGITVYAVGVAEAAIPGYRQLQNIRLPGQGYGDILPKYAAATGGQVFNEFSKSAIETAYNQVTQEARNQYTIGYTTRASASSQYRSIEVRVHRPAVKVIARDGYYPLPVAAK